MYRKPVEHRSNRHRKSIEIYRTSIEHPMNSYRTSVEHLSNIQRTSIEYYARVLSIPSIRFAACYGSLGLVALICKHSAVRTVEVAEPTIWSVTQANTVCRIVTAFTAYICSRKKRMRSRNCPTNLNTENCRRLDNAFKMPATTDIVYGGCMSSGSVAYSRWVQAPCRHSLNLQRASMPVLGNRRFAEASGL